MTGEFSMTSFPQKKINRTTSGRYYGPNRRSQASSVSWAVAPWPKGDDLVGAPAERVLSRQPRLQPLVKQVLERHLETGDVRVAQDQNAVRLGAGAGHGVVTIVEAEPVQLDLVVEVHEAAWQEALIEEAAARSDMIGRPD